jgi:hypothetical protein
LPTPLGFQVEVLQSEGSEHASCKSAKLLISVMSLTKIAYPLTEFSSKNPSLATKPSDGLEPETL